MDHDSSAAPSAQDVPFCQGGHMGGGMIMYMDGFHWGLQGNLPCLNLFVASWTLDTRSKYWMAILCVFVLALLVEASSKLRIVLQKRSARQYLSLARRHSDDELYSHRRLPLRWRLWRSMGMPTVHAMQALLGYLLMLAMMTFAVEMLLAVILGLGVGYAIFFQNDVLSTEQSPSLLHVTTNPCCQFQQDEAREEDDTTRMIVAAGSRESLFCRVGASTESTLTPHAPDTAPLLRGGECHRVV